MYNKKFSFKAYIVWVNKNKKPSICVYVPVLFCAYTCTFLYKKVIIILDYKSGIFHNVCCGNHTKRLCLHKADAEQQWNLAYLVCINKRDWFKYQSTFASWAEIFNRFARNSMKKNSNLLPTSSFPFCFFLFHRSTTCIGVITT